ncbi:hypothetical protein Pcinc_034836 [Petrolisthes cinctipes]|uniref:Uncharacterized protein n=1 Tax=Petrolisthes cinctipes TaxID=88211 RepID=A0AAE1BXS0_PETCI|nr:hypothetical protein Pcinc_034836 [Petrolisthes cinctipes]
MDDPGVFERRTSKSRKKHHHQHRTPIGFDVRQRLINYIWTSEGEAGVKVTGSHDPSDDDSSPEPCGRLLPTVHLSIQSSPPPHTNPHLRQIILTPTPHLYTHTKSASNHIEII